MGTPGAMPRCTARGRPPPGPYGGSVALRPASFFPGPPCREPLPLGASLGPGGRPRRMSRLPTPPDPTSAPASAPSPVPRGHLRQLQARSHPLCPEPPQATSTPGSENLGGHRTGEPPASPLLLAQRLLRVPDVRDRTPQTATVHTRGAFAGQSALPWGCGSSVTPAWVFSLPTCDRFKMLGAQRGSQFRIPGALSGRTGSRTKALRLSPSTTPIARTDMDSLQDLENMC